MVLALPDGTQLTTASASAAAAKLESSGGVIAAGLAFGVVGVLVAGSAADKARAARLEDYRRKEFQDVNLRKDESAYGFVYFMPPTGIPAFTEALLVVRVVDFEEGTSFVVRLPVNGLRFKSASANPR